MPTAHQEMIQQAIQETNSPGGRRKRTVTGTDIENANPSESRSSPRGGSLFPVVPVADETDREDDIVIVKTTEQRLREAERIIASEVFYLNEIPESLSGLSLSAFVFQMLQSALLFLVASRAAGPWYWFVSYPDPQDDNQEGLQPALKEVAHFSVLWLVPGVTLLSGLEHLSCVVFRQTYEWYIARHQNPFRWTEYTISAPLMKVIIAQQVGITDVHLLAAIFVLMSVTIQCAATHENVNAKARSENRAQNWRAFLTGWMGHLAGWVIIFNYFSVYRRRGGDPKALWALMFFMFFLDTTFAVLFTLQWRKVGPFEDYIVGEKGFVVLSFTSKTLLAWLSVINAME